MKKKNNTPKVTASIGGTGTCIYVKINAINVYNIKKTIMNGIWITTLEIKIKNINVVIGSVYCSPSESKIEIINNINQWLDNECENKTVIICGDFNVDLLIDNNNSRKIKNVFNDNGLKQLINKPTRIINESSTLIDLCITNVDFLTVKVLDEDQISDHKIIEMNLNVKLDIDNNNSKKIKIWSNYSSVNLQNEIKKWSKLWNRVSNNDINTKMNCLNENIRASVNHFVKTKLIKQSNEFFDKELELMRRKKNELYKIAQYTRSDDKWLEYRKYKNDYKNKIELKQYQVVQKKT